MVGRKTEYFFVVVSLAIECCETVSDLCCLILRASGQQKSQEIVQFSKFVLNRHRHQQGTLMCVRGVCM